MTIGRWIAGGSDWREREGLDLQTPGRSKAFPVARAASVLGYH